MCWCCFSTTSTSFVPECKGSELICATCALIDTNFDVTLLYFVSLLCGSSSLWIQKHDLTVEKALILIS